MTTFPYWILLSLPAIAALVVHWRGAAWRDVAWFTVALIFIVFVGLRHEVGGDWNAYDRMNGYAKVYTFADVLFVIEPAYFVLNWVSAQTIGTVHLVNLMCAVMSVVPMVLFCRSRPSGWAALVVAVSYLVVVVYMGYTRQAAAIGLCISAIQMLETRKVWRAFLLVVLASSFHRASVGFLVPVIFLSAFPFVGGNVRRTVTISLLAAIVLLVMFSGRSAEVSMALQNYVIQPFDAAAAGVGGPDIPSAGAVDGGGLHSAGAVYRMLLSVIAATAVLYKTRKNLLATENLIWLLIAAAVFALFPLTFVVSTTVDRIGLFLMPIQLQAVSLVGRDLVGERQRFVFWVAVLSFSGLLMGYWLFRSQYAQYWLPYDNVLLHLW